MLGGLYGVVHLRAMPGDPGHDGGGFAAVEEAAMADVRALVEGGIDGVVLENFGSAPFNKGTGSDRIPAHHVATLAVLARAIRAEAKTRIGINCLRNDAMSAIGIAAAVGADFVRVNVLTGAYVTDQGVLEGEAHRVLRYRLALGATSIAIAADVLVKHAVPLAPLQPEAATRDTLQRGRADAVIVTGDATGSPVSRALLERVASAAGRAPVLVGSGMTPDNAAELAPLVHGAIVGTYFKHDGDVSAPVDRDRVQRLVDTVAGGFATVDPTASSS